ncbi:MAG: hypothetical protein KME40_32585 [Komarekiella atlantica HA4396-MV6]|jgi:hypothetical protein|nr:hypothetical protein [Komarekiella atlantica HA4396-MV6]
MLYQNITSDLILELSTAEQQLFSGGREFNASREQYLAGAGRLGLLNEKLELKWNQVNYTCYRGYLSYRELGITLKKGEESQKQDSYHFSCYSS